MEVEYSLTEEDQIALQRYQATHSCCLGTAIIALGLSIAWLVAMFAISDWNSGWLFLIFNIFLAPVVLSLARRWRASFQFDPRYLRRWIVRR